MSIAWFRDLSIIIFALAATAVLIFGSVLAYSLYRRALALFDSQKIVAENWQEISSIIKTGLAKFMKMAAIFQGLRKGVELALELLRKNDKGGSHGEG